MKKMKAVLTQGDVHIDVNLIPGYVAENLAQSAYQAVRGAYEDPEIRAGYERWKAERETADGSVK